MVNLMKVRPLYMQCLSQCICDILINRGVALVRLSKLNFFYLDLFFDV